MRLLSATTLAPGVTGTEQTVRAMGRLIDQGKKDALVRGTAARIVCGLPAFDWRREASTIYEWVRRNIRFTRDVEGKETLQEAQLTLRLGIGDCDDFTILMCSLLGSIGFRTRIVTISSSASPDPRQFSHVYPEALIEGQWVPVDAARRTPAFGVAAPYPARKRIWADSGTEYVDVSGLGYNPSQLPVAYRMNVLPAFRNVPKASAGRLRGTRVLGLGRYGRPAVAGMLNEARRRGVRLRLGQDEGGDGGFDWGALTSLIAAGGTTAANIIAASRAAPYNLYPTTGPTARLPYGAGVGPYGGSISAPGFFSSISPTTLLVGGGLLAVLLLSRR